MGAIMKTRNSVNIRRCLYVTGLVFFLLASGNTPAQGREVYRWVDEDGVVHFTQNPPKAGEYDKYRPNIGKVGTVTPPGRQASIDVSAQQPQISTTEAARETPGLDAQELALACIRARENIVLLEPDTRLLVPDDDGGTRGLEGAERMGWLEKSRSFLNAYCN